MHTLLLHIGTPKTGTTSIQEFLYDNQKELEKFGWYYPRFEDFFHPQSKKNNGSVFCYPDAYHVMNSDSSEWEELWNIVLDALKTRNVILSSEDFWFSSARPFIEEAKKKYDNIKIAVYLRRQDLYIQSLYSDRLRHGEILGFTEWYMAYLKNSDSILKSTYNLMPVPQISYLQTLMEIESIVGRDKMDVRAYERAQWKNENLIEDFLSILGIDISENMTHSSYINVSWTKEGEEILREINKGSIAERAEYGLLGFSYIVKISGRLFALMDGIEDRSYLSKKEKETILEKFSEENEKIVERYFQRKDGNLFFETISDEEKYMPKLSNEQRFGIQVLTKYLLKEKSEIHKMKLYHCIQIMKKDRKLCFFGAGRSCREILEKYHLPVEYVIDNYAGENGGVCEIEIKKTETVKEWDKLFVVITPRNSKKIENQMQSFGLKKERDYILAREYFELVNWNMAEVYQD